MTNLQNSKWRFLGNCLWAVILAMGLFLFYYFSGVGVAVLAQKHVLDSNSNLLTAFYSPLAKAIDRSPMFTRKTVALINLFLRDDQKVTDPDEIGLAAP